MSSIFQAEGLAESGRRDSAVPGLVSTQTSDTIHIDQGITRLRRMKKGAVTAARLIQEDVQAGGFRRKPVMLTLTYREGVEWAPLHLANLSKRIREWARRRGFKIPGVWVMELTQRGRPHYHLLLWLPKGATLPKPDKQGWWPWGHTRIEWARRPIGYLVKYASKGDGDAFPKGARIHGCSGLDRERRSERAWCLSPGWVRDLWPEWQAEPRRAKGGGWVAKASGEWVPSPYGVTFAGGQIYAVWHGFGDG